MTYLLDTHVLLWWLAEDSALSSKAQALISDKRNVIFVSAASIWEIVIKKALGKLHVPEDLESIFQKTHFQELPMTACHAIAIEHLPHHHRDPFDRMLIAQAKCDGLTLITVDQKIKLYDVPCATI